MFLFFVIELFFINDIFKVYFMFVLIFFFWGKFIMFENENVVFKVFYWVVELFDKCIGMIWFNIFVCN